MKSRWTQYSVSLLKRADFTERAGSAVWNDSARQPHGSSSGFLRRTTGRVHSIETNESAHKGHNNGDDPHELGQFQSLDLVMIPAM